MSMPIPKIIHQMWIGSRPPPLSMMNTWKDKHPTFEYIFWNEEEIIKRGMVFQCESKINNIPEIVGKVDVMRWEILLKYGGIFIDADSICIEPLNEEIIINKIKDAGFDGFASFENEDCRRGLVANGTLGFTPQNILCRDIVNYVMYDPDIDNLIANTRAWYSLGPGLLTRFLDTKKYPNMYIYPSYYFLPHHHTGIKYKGHRKVYAYQEWGTSKSSYDTINTVTLPDDLLPPKNDSSHDSSHEWISILISSYNTPRKYVKECLDSIADQIGHIGMEIVWINDGSTENCSNDLENELWDFQKTTRFTTVNYHRLITNIGLYESLSIGVKMCSHPLIFRMDSDDIMVPHRVLHQYQFMKANPYVSISSAGIRMFYDDGKEPFNIIRDVIHPPVVTLNDFMESLSTWFMNQPTMCFYKKAVLEMGNYNKTVYHKTYAEDYALILRFLKEFGAVYNIQEVLGLYRVHPNQTSQLTGDSHDKTVIVNRIIKDIFPEIMV